MRRSEPIFDQPSVRQSFPGLELIYSVARASIAAIAVFSLLFSSTVEARTPEVRVIPEGTLVFGSFMVFGTGARTISASGMVSDHLIVPLEGTIPRPARFTVEYDRGSESKHVLDVTVEVVFTVPTIHRQGGVEGRLSAFQTSLPEYPRTSPGEVIRLRFENCRERLCSKSFNLGARLDVSRQFGGASLSVPIDVDARVIAAERL